MRFSIILAVCLAVLVLFVSVDYTEAGAIKGLRPSASFKNEQLAIHANVKILGRRKSSAQTIVDAIKERRRREHL